MVATIATGVYGNERASAQQIQQLPRIGRYGPRRAKDELTKHGLLKGVRARYYFKGANLSAPGRAEMD